MKDLLKGLCTSTIMGGLMYAVFGLILIIWPETTSRTICHVAATAILLAGIYQIVLYILRGRRPMEPVIRNDLAGGLIMAAAAIFIYIRTDLIISIVPVVLGFAIIVDGVVKLQRAIDLHRLQFEGWFFILILAMFSIALGILMLTEPFEAARTMTIMLGIGLVFSGVTSLAITLFVRSKLKSIPTDVIDIDEE